MAKAPTMKAPPMMAKGVPAVTGGKIGGGATGKTSAQVGRKSIENQRSAKLNGDGAVAPAQDANTGSMKMPADHPLSKSTATRKGGVSSF